MKKLALSITILAFTASVSHAQLPADSSRGSKGGTVDRMKDYTNTIIQNTVTTPYVRNLIGPNVATQVINNPVPAEAGVSGSDVVGIRQVRCTTAQNGVGMDAGTWVYAVHRDGTTSFISSACYNDSGNG